MNKPTRRYDIDWLRILAVFFLFTFHTARIFDTGEINYVQNNELSRNLSFLFVFSFNRWHMQLFFLLSGASSYFALQFRTGAQYAKERFTRLLIPLLFGLLVIVPPQVFYAEKHHNGFSDSFLDFYPTFWKINPDDLTGYTGGWTPAHLWFMLFLFVLSLAALPLFLHFNGQTGKQRLAKIAEALSKPGMIFLLGIPLALSLLLPDLGGKNPFYYFLFLLLGYIFVAEPLFAEIIDHHKGIAALLGIISIGFQLGFSYVQFDLPTMFRFYYSGFVYGVGTLSVLIALLGYSKKWLNFGNRFTEYFSPAAYPLYILHQTLIIVIGYYAGQWTAPVGVKYVAIVIISFVVSVAIYDMLVKCNNLTRFLFGMKPLRR